MFNIYFSFSETRSNQYCLFSHEPLHCGYVRKSISAIIEFFLAVNSLVLLYFELDEVTNCLLISGPNDASIKNKMKQQFLQTGNIGGNINGEVSNQ